MNNRVSRIGSANSESLDDPVRHCVSPKLFFVRKIAIVIVSKLLKDFVFLVLVDKQ